MIRMRLIKEAYKEIVEQDPNTAITQNYIRQLIVSGTVPSIKAGRKYLVNMDLLEEYLKNPLAQNEPHEKLGKIRVVKD